MPNMFATANISMPKMFAIANMPAAEAPAVQALLPAVLPSGFGLSNIGYNYECREPKAIPPFTNLMQQPYLIAEVGVDASTAPVSETPASHACDNKLHVGASASPNVDAPDRCNEPELCSTGLVFLGPELNNHEGEN